MCIVTSNVKSQRGLRDKLMGNEPLSGNLFNILAKWTHTGDKSTVQTLILRNGISGLYA